MVPADLFAPFRQEWVLHQDPALIVVDKPVGVSCQAARPEMPDDLVARLRLYLSRRHALSPRAVYLGVHQRIDQETSGVILYACDRAANKSLADQFETRRVQKTYVAAVTGWKSDATEETLEHWLMEGRGRKNQVVSSHRRGARLAKMRVRCLERVADRALLEVFLETGRLHQIRTQLAHVGTPVAGDRAYGRGAMDSAHRLMLHARTLGLEHPTERKRFCVDASLPSDFQQWVRTGSAAFPRSQEEWKQRLTRAAQRRWGIVALTDTTALRLWQEGADGPAGISVDVYGAFAVVHVTAEDALVVRETLSEALMQCGFEGVYVKVHPRRKDDLGDAERAALAPRAPTRGGVAPNPHPVRENGVPLLVRLGDGLRTGLFLDQRDNRLLVRELAEGKRVLNLFSYTCTFGMFAAAGHAGRVVNVDASKAVLERGQGQAEAARLARGQEFVRADVFDWLARSNELFDLVIVDPPTYATTRSSTFRSGKDWVALVLAVFRVSDRGGQILACSNDTRLSMVAFRRFLHEAGREASRSIRRMRELRFPTDFPAGCHGAAGNRVLIDLD